VYERGAVRVELASDQWRLGLPRATADSRLAG